MKHVKNFKEDKDMLKQCTIKHQNDIVRTLYRCNKWENMQRGGKNDA